VTPDERKRFQAVTRNGAPPRNAKTHSTSWLTPPTLRSVAVGGSTSRCTGRRSNAAKPRRHSTYRPLGQRWNSFMAAMTPLDP
jgi:hypothetical protein